MNLDELLELKPKEQINYTDLLNCDEWISKRDIMKERDKNKCTICKTEKSIGPLYSGNNRFYFRKINGEVKTEKEKIHLEVHHKLYIIGKLPWEYEKEELITVCNPCHKKIHENEEISISNQSKTTKLLLENCDRCGGSGFLNEYYYVEGGICFNCRGIGNRIPIFEL